MVGSRAYGSGFGVEARGAEVGSFHVLSMLTVG